MRIYGSVKELVEGGSTHYFGPDSRDLIVKAEPFSFPGRPHKIITDRWRDECSSNAADGLEIPSGGLAVEDTASCVFVRRAETSVSVERLLSLANDAGLKGPTKTNPVDGVYECIDIARMGTPAGEFSDSDQVSPEMEQRAKARWPADAMVVYCYLFSVVTGGSGDSREWSAVVALRDAYLISVSEGGTQGLLSGVDASKPPAPEQAAAMAGAAQACSKSAACAIEEVMYLGWSARNQ